MIMLKLHLPRSGCRNAPLPGNTAFSVSIDGSSYPSAVKQTFPSVKAKLVFLCLHSLVPSYFSLYFTRFSNIHNYSTRQSMRLSLPNVKQNFGERSFLFTGTKIFNNLPLNIVKSENIQTFCRRARHFFLS